MGRKARIVSRLSKGIESYLFKKNKITLFKGQGRLEGPRSVVVKGEGGGETRVSTKNVILATGSRPRSLPGLSPDGKSIITSDEILELEAGPARAWSSSGRARWGSSSRRSSPASAPR